MSASDEAVERAADAIQKLSLKADQSVRLGDLARKDFRLLATVALEAGALANHRAAMKEVLEEARKAIASLDDDALGTVPAADEHTGEAIMGYSIRDELLARIDAALSAYPGEIVCASFNAG